MTVRSCAWVIGAWFLAGCADEPGPPCVASGAPARPLLVLESDWQASAVGRLDEDGCLRELPSVTLGGDPTLSRASGRVFVNVRDEGTLAEIDPGTGAIVGKLAAYAPGDLDGPRVNPWDVAVAADGTLWVARYDRASLAVLDASGAFSGEVDLAAFADDDGLPEMSAVTAAGSDVLVALERLARLPGPPAVVHDALLVRIDVAARSAATSYPLPARNPYGPFEPDRSRAPGAFATMCVPGALDAIRPDEGIALVELATGDSWLLARESELGGSPLAAIVVAEQEGYALVMGPGDANPTSLVRFDPRTGARTAVLADTPGFLLSGLEVVGDAVYVGDRTREAPRLRSFERTTLVERPAVAVHALPPLALAAAPP